MTRSSRLVHTHILDFDDDFERTLRRKRKQPELNSSRFCSESEFELETDLEGEHDMAADNQTIKELSALGLDNAVALCIQFPRATQGETDEFESKSSSLHHIPKYHGLSMEDPNKHLKEFEVVCSGMTPISVDSKILKMKAFPFSLLEKVNKAREHNSCNSCMLRHEWNLSLKIDQCISVAMVAFGAKNVQTELAIRFSHKIFIRSWIGPNDMWLERRHSELQDGQPNATNCPREAQFVSP